MTSCQRILPGEPYDYPCTREAVFEGYCRACAFVMLPERRGELPPRVKLKREPKSVAKQKPKREESNLQVTCCKLLKMLPSTLYWHTPSSFYRGANSGPGFFGYIARLKAMGWFSGIPDLCIIFRNVHGSVSVCFAELKFGYGTTSDSRDAFLDRANAIGCFTAKVKSLEDLITLLRLAGHPTIIPT